MELVMAVLVVSLQLRKNLLFTVDRHIFLFSCLFSLGHHQHLQNDSPGVITSTDRRLLQLAWRTAVVMAGYGEHCIFVSYCH